MLDPYTLGEALRLERQLLAARQARELKWMEHLPRSSAGSAFGRVRRRLARALLVLADRLDPRAVVSVPQVPSRPTLNGTLHHA
jgi:hypothetical protein